MCVLISININQSINHQSMKLIVSKIIILNNNVIMNYTIHSTFSERSFRCSHINALKHPLLRWSYAGGVHKQECLHLVSQLLGQTFAKK